NYGAGVVMIWDRGTYTSLAENRADDIKTLRAGLRSGNLKFRLDGEKLQGEFALVKLHSAEDNSWLLIKHNDDFAVHKPYNSEDQVPGEIKEMRNNKSGEAAKLPAIKKSVTEKKSPDPDIENDNAPGGERAYTPMTAKLEAKVFDE